MLDSRDDSLTQTLRPWEEPATFSDTLYEWMQRAPWLALSAAAHVMALLILTLIPWRYLLTEPEPVVICRIETPPETFVDAPLLDEPDDIIVPEDTADPTLVDSNATEEDPIDCPEGPSDLDDNSDPAPSLDPFESTLALSTLGIGGGPTGPGGRLRGNGRRPSGGRGTELALERGLSWLARHQSPDGSWDGDGFMHNGSDGACECTQPGESSHDVGLTGLALLAFLGEGHTTLQGQYRDTVTRGVQWLKNQQDYDTGLLGMKIGHAYMYDHAIATLALTEAYYFSRSPLLRGTAQKAVNFITRARNPYGAWRYDEPPTGQNDTSVTGWMVFALKSAEEAGLRIDDEAFAGALSWFDDATDPTTGRTGYDARGNSSSRVDGLNDHYPPEKGEAMTAVALLYRFFLGQDPEEDRVMERSAKLLLKKVPDWDPDGAGTDMYYWYYGSYAMYQMGGRYWREWRKAMEPAVVESQSTDGHFAGSWDPVGPWGYSGGRVYSTAMMTLCLEVYFRYSRVLGARAIADLGGTPR